MPYPFRLAKLRSLWRSPRKSAVFSNTELTAATNLIIAVLGIVTGTMAARLLGPHGRGELTAIQTYPTLIGYLTMLGTDQAVVYFSAQQPERAGRYVASAALISLAASLPFMTIAYLVMPRLLSAQSPQTIIAARWYLLVVPPTALMYLALYSLRGCSDFVAWNTLRLMYMLAWAAILAIALSIGNRDPRWLAGTYLAVLVLLLIPSGLTLRRRVAGTCLPQREQFKPMLAYGLPCIASSFPFLMNIRLDQMLMAALLAPSALGLYVAAVAWSGAINPMMSAIGSALFPKVAGHETQVDRLRSFRRGTRLAALLALIATPLLAAATPWGMILLFGRKFQAAIPAGLILVPAGAIWALNLVIEEGFRGLGKPVVVLYAELAGMVTTAVSLYVLLRPMGILGASIASFAGYSTVMAALLLQARWLTGQSPAALLLPGMEELHAATKRMALLARRMVPAISRA